MMLGDVGEPRTTLGRLEQGCVRLGRLIGSVGIEQVQHEKVPLADLPLCQPGPGQLSCLAAVSAEPIEAVLVNLESSIEPRQMGAHRDTADKRRRAKAGLPKDGRKGLDTRIELDTIAGGAMLMRIQPGEHGAVRRSGVGLLGKRILEDHSMPRQIADPRRSRALVAVCG